MTKFVRIKTRTSDKKNFSTGAKEQIIILRPIFSANCNDLMKKGNKFYAYYNYETGLWKTDEDGIVNLIDNELYSKRDELSIANVNGIYLDKNRRPIYVETMNDSDTNVLRDYRVWLNNLPPNHSYKQLDSFITYKDEEVNINDYRSKRLDYNLVDADCPAYNELMSTLYDEENRKKLEWAIGSVFAGESIHIEKMIILYGKPKSGKSTVLDIIKKLFEGYWSIFIASELTNKNSQFATALLKDNPLVAIQDDGSMSKIDSPIINEIISHKDIVINEKGKQQYSIKSKALLFMATNEYIDLNNEMGGMSRRLLDVYPTNNLIPVTKYRKLVKDIDYELGAIAKHCLDVFNSMGKEYYINYTPIEMINKSNYIRNFIWDNYEFFTDPKNDPIPKSILFNEYCRYIESLKIQYALNGIKFGEQMRFYYNSFEKSKWLNGKTYRNVYSGFRHELFDELQKDNDEKDENYIWLKMDQTKSKLDKIGKNWLAQYTTKDGHPKRKWENVTTTLKELDTTQEHFLKMPTNYISLDFDFKDPETGEKSPEINIKEASKYPATYAEFSRSGGVHLYYIYDGDVGQLENRINENIEIKHGKEDYEYPIRRKVTKCNGLDVLTITGGLPLKEKKVAINKDFVMNEKHIRNMIERNLKKEFHGATKPSIDFIFKILEDAYESGVPYDVTDMRTRVLAFGNNSTHQSEACLKIINKMHFKSSEDLERKDGRFEEDTIIFFDCEVFPNFFCICYKPAGENQKVVQLINPTASDVEKLFRFKLVGFNNRRYDNHILYAASLGYNNAQLFNLSQKIINKSANCYFGEAYNLSYTDIYDFASAGNKQSLKKWEIQLGINHVENSYPWDQDLPEAHWQEVADYCSNDVMATEAVFNHLQSDFIAREILADLSGLTVNDTTNQHTTKIIFGNDRNPQAVFNYRDLSEDFPGYKFDAGVSTYRGEVVGEGGYVYAEPGCYTDVALLDVASMHPSSITALNLFGPYTKNFNDLKDARLAIKHKDYKKLEKLLDGKLVKYIKDESKIKDLPNALKTVINSVYGMTASKFDFKFKDPRNIDNIVAKRGALFMVDLKHAVQEKGFTVAHIKTDSIKIPNATKEIIDFVMEFGKKWGYTFEHEATYKRMCLVNDAVYIALYSDNHWSATGAEFQVPYVFKTLFSHEEIEFADLCEAKSTQTSLYLDFNENLPEDEHDYQFVGKVGNFCPVKPGCDGGILYRQQEVKGELKYYSVGGTKGYRWKEASIVKDLGLEDQIDMTYFEKLDQDAIDEINQYTNFDWFANPNSNNEEVPYVK